MRPARPWIWLFLNLPFGATSGFVTVMLAFILKKQGMSDAVIAGIGALNLFPHTWKFFWAPLADATLTRKRWYISANLASCAAIVVIAFVPINQANLGALKTLIVLNSFAVTLIGMSVEGLMAHGTAPEQRGAAAGWFQAGNLGGNGLGGGVGLLVAEHVSTKAAFITIAIILFACTAALKFVPEAPRLIAVEVVPGPLWERFVAALKRFLLMLLEVMKGLWGMVASRRGVVALILVFLPIGSAALTYLFSGGLAEDWGADADLVATTTGLAGGLVSAAGCLAGGWFSDKVGRRLAYALSGVIMALVTVAWAVGPQVPGAYVVFVLLYQFGSGIAYGCFTGFVLEVIGTGAAATKYNLFASLSNIPILYMAQVDGWASTKYGTISMLYTDGASEIAGIVVFVIALALLRPGRAPVPAHLATEVAQETDR